MFASCHSAQKRQSLPAWRIADLSLRGFCPFGESQPGKTGADRLRLSHFYDFGSKIIFFDNDVIAYAIDNRWLQPGGCVHPLRTMSELYKLYSRRDCLRASALRLKIQGLRLARDETAIYAKGSRSRLLHLIKEWPAQRRAIIWYLRTTQTFGV